MSTVCCFVRGKLLRLPLVVNAQGAFHRSNSSFKEAAKSKFGKEANSRVAYKELRQLIREYGVDNLEAELVAEGLVKEGKLTTGTKPFNFFARLAAEEMKQDEMVASNMLLGGAGKRWLVACNRKENDEQYQSGAPEWVGRASMSARHRFLTARDLDWRWFNVLTVGIGGGGPDELRRAIVRMEDMLATARAFAQAEGWSSNLGLYFHCFPHNSVPSLHLHLVDLDAIGPTYNALQYKNLPAEDVLAVLRDEAAGPPMERAWLNVCCGIGEVGIAALASAILAGGAMPSCDEIYLLSDSDRVEVQEVAVQPEGVQVLYEQMAVPVGTPNMKADADSSRSEGSRTPPHASPRGLNKLKEPPNSAPSKRSVKRTLSFTRRTSKQTEDDINRQIGEEILERRGWYGAALIQGMEARGRRDGTLSCKDDWPAGSWV